MIKSTQGLVLTFLGAVMLRLSIGDAYLRYVNDWMRWPLIVSGALLILFALGPLLGNPDAKESITEGHSHVPRATWLLVLPGVVAFVISPPALGAYLAERGNTPPPPPPPVASAGFAELDAAEPVGIEVSEFTWRAADAQGETLVDRTVAMKGFVSTDDEGNWYLTRVSINCCAADSSAYRIRVEGAPAPPRESWVLVTGTYVPGTGDTTGANPAAIEAESITKTKAPKDTYE